MKKISLIIIKFLRKYFAEVGYIRGKVNYYINSLIYKKYKLSKIKTSKLDFKNINSNEFLESGYVKIKFNESFNSEVKKVVNKNIDINSKNSNSFKSYWKDLFQEEKEIKIFISQELEKMGILDYACNYFGSVPLIRSISCYYTKGQKKINISSSMNWHKDCHHNKLIKIMYFVSDVFDENGPTTVIDLKTSEKVKYVNFPDYFDDHSLMSQNINVKKNQLTGKSGFGYIIDTARCYHMGSRSQNDRIQIIITLSPYESNLSPFKNIYIDEPLNEHNKLLVEKYLS